MALDSAQEGTLLTPALMHRLLKHGEITECEQIPWGSNYTFCVAIRSGGLESRACYKPRRGERPLWDFPNGTLYRRECAAYVASQGLGWPFIPPTLIRHGPYGIGSAQFWVESEPPSSFKELLDPADDQLARIAAFDIVSNNADRKAGHILRSADGKLWGIDQGLCFNVDPKVRTVLQHFCGQPVPERMLGELRAFRSDTSRVDSLVEALCPLLEEEEIGVFLQRIDWVLERGLFPNLSGYRSVPWPPF